MWLDNDAMEVGFPEHARVAAWVHGVRKIYNAARAEREIDAAGDTTDDKRARKHMSAAEVLPQTAGGIRRGIALARRIWHGRV